MTNFVIQNNADILIHSRITSIIMEIYGIYGNLVNCIVSLQSKMAVGKMVIY